LIGNIMFLRLLKNLIVYVWLLYPLLSFNQNYDKWVVVTTIQYPTSALEKLAKLKDWRLVVVADKKTPLDWHLDNCDFLSVDDQQTLSYKITQLPPWNHYSRKNIGYLYAIEHGASIIYETVDDNMLIDDTIKYLSEKNLKLQYKTDATAINVYADFGQSLVWPRGFPLKDINEENSYQLMLHETCIPIQQGLVNNDPDVDALFRLTHVQEIFFDSNQKPVSLPAKTMCPFNSQNTIFHYNAFWGLLLPITTKFRVCDIWRSYWVQRILWDINASLCFLPPTAIQYRNEHDLLKDFADEIDLYLKAGEFVRTAIEWDSTQVDLADRITNLMEKLVKKEFFKSEELIFLNAWLEDLKMLGYKMPTVFLE